jgi:hypothetical protein
MGKRLPFALPVYGILIAYILLTYTTLLLDGEPFRFFVAEDHFFEYLSALAFLGAGVFFLTAFWRSRLPAHRVENPPIKRLAYVALAFVLIIGAGEEISWGQRVLGYETPEVLRKLNVQEEATLHNLEVFEGEEGIITVDRLFDIFWFTFAVLGPFTAALFTPFQRFLSRFVPIPHWSLSVLFLINYGWAKVAIMLFSGLYTYPKMPFRQAVHEIKESNYAILFTLVAVFVAFVALKTKEAVAPIDPDSESEMI